MHAKNLAFVVHRTPSRIRIKIPDRQRQGLPVGIGEQRAEAQIAERRARGGGRVAEPWGLV